MTEKKLPYAKHTQHVEVGETFKDKEGKERKKLYKVGEGVQRDEGGHINRNWYVFPENRDGESVSFCEVLEKKPF